MTKQGVRPDAPEKERLAAVQRDSPTDGPCVSVRVPGKINPFLSVGGRRSDGFHDLVTVYQSVSVYDRLRAGLIGPPSQGHHPAARRRMRLRLWHDAGPAVPSAEENLAVKAARALGAAAEVIDLAFIDERAARMVNPDDEFVGSPCTVLDLRKDIPVAGGMAGGSADAAAALIALNELWNCELRREDLRRVAAGLGSDVPFCLLGGTALGTGRGVQLAPVLCRGTYHWVVCQSAQPLPTADVYRSWDRCGQRTGASADAVLQAVRNGDHRGLAAALHNDLEVAAFDLQPGLRENKRALLDAGALGAVLSGSGPTLLGLAGSAADASALAERVAGRFARVVVAQSPVGGPEIRRC